MSIVIAKFGGSSLANQRRLKHSAQVIKKILDDGNIPIVVVSAMYGFTDHLTESIRNITQLTRSLHHDVILSSGEQITAGLFALTLEELNIKAKTLMGWQIPIFTDSNFTDASIKEVQTEKLNELINRKITPVVAGFQGIDERKRITTLGRGGSDLTAIEIAVAVKAQRCLIFKDVEGVFSSDPKIIHSASKIDFLTFDETFEISKNGAKVIAKKAAERAFEHHLPLTVLSSFVEGKGTEIVEDIKNKDRVISLCFNPKEEKVSFVGKNIILKEKFLLKEILPFLKRFVVNIEKNQNCVSFQIKRNFSTNILSKIHSQLGLDAKEKINL